MLQPRKIKICLVGDALSGGGAERVHAFLSEYFHSNGINVHNVVVQDMITYHYSGSLLNLGQLKDQSNGPVNKLRRFRVLRSYIRQHQFDFIIDFRMRKKPLQDLLVAKLIYTAPAVYTVHSSHTEWYMPRQPWLTRLIYAKAYGVVSITNKMKAFIEATHDLKNVVNIYNPVDAGYVLKRSNERDFNPGYSYILSMGRMGSDNVKQFDKLIEAYAASVLPANRVKLLLLGDGSEKDNLASLADSKGLKDDIVFMDFQENPYVYMKNALFYVLSSKFEGLPMVLLESLACGTPVVAFDCFTGPSEIITDRQNGLLIKDQDIEKLTDGIELLFTDSGLYTNCRENAVKSIEKFSLQRIGRQWLDYLKIETP